MAGSLPYCDTAECGGVWCKFFFTELAVFIFGLRNASNYLSTCFSLVRNDEKRSPGDEVDYLKIFSARFLPGCNSGKGSLLDVIRKAANFSP